MALPYIKSIIDIVKRNRPDVEVSIQRQDWMDYADEHFSVPTSTDVKVGRSDFSINFWWGPYWMNNHGDFKTGLLGTESNQLIFPHHFPLTWRYAYASQILLYEMGINETIPLYKAPESNCNDFNVLVRLEYSTGECSSSNIGAMRYKDVVKQINEHKQIDKIYIPLYDSDNNRQTHEQLVRLFADIAPVETIELEFNEYVDWLPEHVALMLTNSTGLMHLANYVGVNTVDLYCNKMEEGAFPHPLVTPINCMPPSIFNHLISYDHCGKDIVDWYERGAVDGIYKTIASVELNPISDYSEWVSEYWEREHGNGSLIPQYMNAFYSNHLTSSYVSKHCYPIFDGTGWAVMNWLRGIVGDVHD